MLHHLPKLPHRRSQRRYRRTECTTIQDHLPPPSPHIAPLPVTLTTPTPISRVTSPTPRPRSHPLLARIAAANYVLRVPQVGRHSTSRSTSSSVLGPCGLFASTDRLVHGCSHLFWLVKALVCSTLLFACPSNLEFVACRFSWLASHLLTLFSRFVLARRSLRLVSLGLCGYNVRVADLHQLLGGCSPGLLGTDDIYIDLPIPSHS